MADLRQESLRILAFLLAGTIAFGVDLGMYLLAVALLGSPALAKGVAWGVAVVTTFSINSLLTFRTAPGGNSGPTPILQGLDWRQHERPSRVVRSGYDALRGLSGLPT